MASCLIRTQAVYEEVKAAAVARHATLPREKIAVTLPDGKSFEGVSNQTTPFEIAKQISNSLAKKVTGTCRGAVTAVAGGFNKFSPHYNSTDPSTHRCFMRSQAVAAYVKFTGKRHVSAVAA